MDNAESDHNVSDENKNELCDLTIELWAGWAASIWSINCYLTFLLVFPIWMWLTGSGFGWWISYFARILVDPMGMHVWIWYANIFASSNSNLLQQANCVVSVCVVSVSKRGVIDRHGKSRAHKFWVRARANETDSKSKTMSVLKTGSY